MPEIMLRRVAKKQGLSEYFTGKPCKHGHICYRKTYNGECAACKPKFRKKYYDRRDKEKHNIRQRRGYLSRRERIAGRKRPELCEICGRSGKICWDHDHSTGKFRGWICYGCNVALGHIEDSPKILRALISYLHANGRQFSLDKNNILSSGISSVPWKHSVEIRALWTDQCQ